MSKGPLDGITVIDMTRVLAGPYCTMLLHDLGARVIKVETPGHGDDARHFGPFAKHGKSAYFMSLNRGKESIALNLKDDEDRKVFEALLAKADVLVENYRAGTMEKLGYGWDRLEQDFPQLIYAAASGFGQTGPYANRAAYDMVVQGMGGIMSITGHPGGPPTRVGTSVGDITAGLFTTVGVNAALLERTKTGKGMMIDVSMLDCQLAILENAVARYVTSGAIPGPLGARHPSITPFEAYESGDGHIIIAAGNNKLFASMAEALGKPEMAEDPRYLSNKDRAEHVDVLKEEMEAVLKTNTTEHWMHELEKAGVPCGPINNVEQVMTDPQILSRNMVVSIEDPQEGHFRMAGNPIKMSAHADPSTRGHVPDLDEHREAILKELGLA